MQHLVYSIIHISSTFCLGPLYHSRVTTGSDPNDNDDSKCLSLYFLKFFLSVSRSIFEQNF